MAKAVKVKAYTYRIGGKTVKVKAHVRKTKGRSGVMRRSKIKPLSRAFKESARAMRRSAKPALKMHRYKSGTKGRRR